MEKQLAQLSTFLFYVVCAAWKHLPVLPVSKCVVKSHHFSQFTNFFITQVKTGQRGKLCGSLSVVNVEYLEKYLSISKNGADLMTSPAYAATPSRILLTTNIFRHRSPPPSQYRDEVTPLSIFNYENK